MKRLSAFKSSIKVLGGLLLMSLLFTACSKDDDSTRTPAAGLMAFNLSPDQSAAAFNLSGNYLGTNTLNFTNYTGAYLPVYVGNREVRSIDYNSGNTIAISNVNFIDSMYYSAFLVGTTGNYKNVFVEDRLETLAATSGKAWVRYINAIPDSTVVPTVSITANSESPITSSAAYATVSPFTAVAAGNVTTAITNGTTINTSRSLTFEENKIYTVLFVGLPSATTSDKMLQVKFITNGTITP